MYFNSLLRPDINTGAFQVLKTFGCLATGGYYEITFFKFAITSILPFRDDPGNCMNDRVKKHSVTFHPAIHVFPTNTWSFFPEINRLWKNVTHSFHLLASLNISFFTTENNFNYRLKAYLP